MLGVLVAMASVPVLRVISDRFRITDIDHSAAGSTAPCPGFADVAETVSSWLSNPVVVDHLGTITKFALISVLCLLPAVLIRLDARLVVDADRPDQQRPAGRIRGRPLTIWLGIASWYLFRLIVWLFHITRSSPGSPPP